MAAAAGDRFGCPGRRPSGEAPGFEPAVCDSGWRWWGAARQGDVVEQGVGGVGGVVVVDDDNYSADPTYTLFDDVTLTSSAPPPPAGITNGGFEAGSLTGW